MALDIDVSELSFGYPETPVLGDVDARVEPGEFVAVIGPSGCGKTTLLSLVDGRLAPDEGTVRVGGDPVTDPRPDVATVFQDFRLFPWRTVRANVELGLEIQGVPESERRERAATWLDTVGLSDVADSRPHELSGGMRQRVGLARALAVDPEVLLMDEPFGALDAQTRDRLQTELLRLLEDRPKTVLFVTHDVGEAAFLADRVLVLGGTPAGVVAEFDVDIERPRWSRRAEVETSDGYENLRRDLRDALGLDALEG